MTDLSIFISLHIAFARVPTGIHPWFSQQM